MFEEFSDVMIDTLELATQFLRDRHEDGVMDENDEGLLRQCETVLEWAKLLRLVYDSRNFK